MIRYVSTSTRQTRPLAPSGNTELRQYSDRSSPSREKIYRLLNSAAEAGEQCPTNQEIADLIGYSSTSKSSDAIAALERAGRITVERFQCSRRVTITASGKSTVLTGKRAPHWRLAGTPA